MRNIIISATFLAITLSGCAQNTAWLPGPYAKMDLEQARNECEFEKEKGAPIMDLNANVWAQGAIRADIFEKCMKAKGFTQASAVAL